MLMTGKSGAKEEKSDPTCEFRKKIPKARDNSTADLRVKDDKLEMVVFGGGMHKIGFNDIIIIDLKQVIRKHLSFLEDDEDEE